MRKKLAKSFYVQSNECASMIKLFKDETEAGAQTIPRCKMNVQTEFCYQLKAQKIPHTYVGIALS